MSQPNDSADFFGGGAKYFGFPVPGTTITGTIIDDPVTRQQTDPESGDLKTWKDGSPMLVLVVQLATNLRDPSEPDDDGSRSVWVSVQGMRQAIGKAVRQAGRKQLDVGGTLTVTYVGDGEKTNPKLNAPKLFSAHYVAPSDSAAFLNGDVAPPVYAQAPPPAWQQPVTPAPQYAAPPQQVQHVAPPVAPPAAIPANLPPGMTPEVWQQLTPEARTALASITG